MPHYWLENLPAADLCVKEPCITWELSGNEFIAFNLCDYQIHNFYSFFMFVLYLYTQYHNNNSAKIHLIF